MILLVYSCNNTTDKTTQKKESKQTGILLDSILARGKIIAITNNTPTSYFIYKGRPMRYQFELLSRFAKSINVELEIHIMP